MLSTPPLDWNTPAHTDVLAETRKWGGYQQ
jgi:hypothetical protein